LAIKTIFNITRPIDTDSDARRKHRKGEITRAK